MKQKAPSFSVGDRVRIADHVTRTAWNSPCNWGGTVGTITAFGGRFSGVRLWRVALNDDCPFGGNDFAEGVLERVASVVEDLL